MEFGTDQALVDQTAAAVYLGVTSHHIRRLIRTGRIRAWRRNSITFVAMEDLRQFAHQREAYTRKPGYDNAHRQVYRLHGPAKDHVCHDCGASADDWSYDGGDPDEQFDQKLRLWYSMDPTRYTARCRLCHWRHDGLTGTTTTNDPIARHLTRKDAQRP